MKKIIYAILGIFMMAGCTDDHLEDMPVQPEKETAGTVKLNFSVQIPEVKEAASRSFTAPAINTLYLAVFDGNGYLSYVAEATRTDGEKGLGTAKNPIPFTVELSQTPNKRIIHFLTNTTIDANDFGTENELIGALYTTDKQDAYWQRVELDNGVQFEYTDANNNKQYDSGEAITANTIGTKFTAVPLIRNFAKITIKTADGITTAGNVGFTLEGFTVVNVPDRGSVAPFNTNKGRFTQYVDANKDAYSYSDLTGSTINYTGFIPNTTQIDGSVADEDDFLSPMGTFYMYERNNQAKNANRTFVIVKGKFGNEASSYYKIDIAAKNGNVMRYFDILRNFSYNIVITNVESSGATSPDLAAGMTGSHNNLSAAVETQSLLNISDGAERLFVNYTEYVFVATGETMQLKYRYVPNISAPNTEDNDIATYSWDNENQSVASITPIASATDDAQGWRALTVTAGTMDPYETKSQILTLVAGNLSRTVNFILRAKYNFSNEMATSPTPNKTLKSPFVYSFTIPNNIPESLFPMTFIVQGDPENIYPNAELNSLPVQVLDGQQTFGYEREVTWDEYQNTDGIINCYFRVNTTSYANTEITVSNKFFNDCKPVKLDDNNTNYAFSNLIVNAGEAVPYGTDKNVTFKFDMPFVPTEGTDVTITANKMSAMSRATTFTYRATQAGTQTVTFTTGEFASADRIKLEAANYITGIKAYDNVLKIKAKNVTGSTNPTLGTNSTIRVYASESDAKVYGNNHLAQVSLSTLLNNETAIALNSLTEESLVWFAYEGTDRIYVASATAGKLANATADIIFNVSYEKPLEVTASLSSTTIELGTGKSVTLILNFNKAGTVSINGQRLTYNSKTAGTVTGTGSSITFEAPSAGEYRITFNTADALRGGTVTIANDEIDTISLLYSRPTTIGNKSVLSTNAPTNSINSMQIKMGSEIIGSCSYYYKKNYSRELQNITFTTYSGDDLITNETSITITGSNKTISTTIGNLINGNNLQFNK